VHVAFPLDVGPVHVEQPTPFAPHAVVVVPPWHCPPEQQPVQLTLSQAQTPPVVQ
jgi:hypothetical protein